MKTREKLIDDVLLAGAMCSNCCFNLAQRSELPERDAQSMREAFKTWDKAATALRTQMRIARYGNGRKS